MSAIRETIKETTRVTTTSDSNKVTITETVKESTKETTTNDNQEDKPLPDSPTLGRLTAPAPASAPAQPTHVSLLHRRDHNSLDDEVTLETPNPTRVFCDRDHAIAGARQLWGVSDYKLLCGQPNQILTVHDEDGNERNGRILFPCDDAEGREKEAQAKIWVERCAVE